MKLSVELTAIGRGRGSHPGNKAGKKKKKNPDIIYVFEW